MRQYPGFEPKDKRVPAQPVPDYNPVVLTKQRLAQLFTEARRCRLSPRGVGLLRKLATLPPELRLVVNIKTVLGLMAQGDVGNILLDGITDDERRALLEIAGSRLTPASKETAHALFSMETRLMVVNALRPAFKLARVATDQVTEDEIDNAMKES